MLHGLERHLSDDDFYNVNAVSPIIADECMSFWYGVEVLVEEQKGMVTAIFGQCFVSYKSLAADFQKWAFDQ